MTHVNIWAVKAKNIEETVLINTLNLLEINDSINLPPTFLINDVKQH